MKDKILAALRNKYKNLGLGEKVLEGIADMLAITTTEESQIDNAVNGVENLAKGFQSDADRIRTEAAAKAKAEQSKGAEPAKAEPTPTEEMPSWAKGLVEANQALLAKVNAIESGKTTESRKTILETKLKDAAPSVKAKILKDFQRMSFEKDEDFDSYLAETEADLTALNQEFVNQGFANGHVPQVAGEGATEKAIEADIAAWAAATIPDK